MLQLLAAKIFDPKTASNQAIRAEASSVIVATAIGMR